MPEHEQEHQEEYSFYSLFVPLTKFKSVCIIVLTGIIVFFNSLFNPFQFDDFTQIVNNSAIFHITSIPTYFYTTMENARNTIPTLFSGQYRPLLYTIYTVIGSSFGANAFLFHLLQLIIHITNAILIFYLFSRFLDRKIAFMFSLLFLVHPINSESVIYIADLQDVLFAFFGLLALVSIVSNKKVLLSLKRLSLIGLCLYLSLISKETGILFLIVLPLYVSLFNKINISRIALTITVVLVFYISSRYIASIHALPILVASLMSTVPLTVRLINIPQIIFYYFSKFLVPIQLSVIHEWIIKQITFQNFVFPLIVDLGIIIFLIFVWSLLYKKKESLFKWYTFFILWIGIGLSIHLQIIPLDVTVADRYFYFPMIGLLGIIGIGISLISRYFTFNKNITKFSIILFCSILFLLSILTIQRNAQWSSKASLYSHDVQYAGSSPILYADYGGLLIANAQFDKAKPYLINSVSINPLLGFNLNNLAVVYEHEKNYTKAKALYWENIHLNANAPRNVAIAYCGLARIALLHENNPNYAKQLSLIGLQKNPSDTQLPKFLALSEYQLGDKGAALQVAKKLEAVSPTEGGSLYDFIANDKPMSLVDSLYGVTYSY